jgi:hypothetical protein
MLIIGRRSDNGVEAQEPHLWAADGFLVRPSEKTTKRRTDTPAEKASGPSSDERQARLEDRRFRADFA